MSIHKAEAIILSTQNFRQTSLIANFYTREFGKLSGILKGVRQDPAKFNSNLDVLSLNEIVFYKSGTSSLHLISQCDLRKDFRAIKNNLEKMQKAFLLLQLLNSLTVPEAPDENVFNLLVSCLEQLDNGCNLDKIRIIFKIKLLDYSGFKPNLDSCVSCNNKVISQARLSLKLGGLLCDTCLNKDIKARNVFRGTVASILYIEKNDFNSVLRLGISREIMRELNQVLDAFLTYHIGKNTPAK